LLRFVAFEWLHNVFSHFFGRDLRTANVSFEQFLLVNGVVRREDLVTAVGVPQANTTQEVNAEQAPKDTCEQSAEVEMIRNIIGGLSWMLSCTYSQVLSMPASYVNPYVYQMLNVSAQVGIPGAPRGARRVAPSMTSLEAALMYNLEMQFDSRVTVHVEEASEPRRFRLHTASEKEDTRTCTDRHFDYVVIATEPMSVRKIVAPSSSKGMGAGTLLPESMLQIFDSFVVSYSQAVVHSDDAVMPQRKEDWCVFNVFHGKPRQEGQGFVGAEQSGALSRSSVEAATGSQITVHYNAFFGDESYFGTEAKSNQNVNLFFTWNPIQEIESTKVLARTSFARVLHDARNAAGLHEKLDRELQGRVVPGLFFCGAYSVPGMGLLEQGCVSGKRAASRILGELESSNC
jgi:predicted NAD/FAD-binding protein